MQDALNRIPLAGHRGPGFSNTAAAGLVPNPLPTPLYLNLGCGLDVRPGFLNIDLFSDDPSVVAMDVRALDLPDSCADAILASDILEHFSHRESAALLKEWARVLKPGGTLVLRLPSLRLQCKAYLEGTWNAEIASYMIFGGQTNPGDYHAAGFDPETLRRLLTQCGFDVEEVTEHDTPQDKGYINLNMSVRATKKATISSWIAPTEAREKPVSGARVAPQYKPQLNIVWEGSQFVWHSLALINRNLCKNILDSGVAELTIVPYEEDRFGPGNDPDLQNLLAHDIRVKGKIPDATATLPFVWVRHQWPPSHEEPKGALWLIMQPWEFSRLRKDFVVLFNRADEVWTPSTYSRRAFVESGVDPNKVQVVPNGVDVQVYSPEGELYPLKSQATYRFLFVGGTIYRKGIDILLEAYRQSFSALDDVVLVIKDMGGDSYYRGQTQESVIAQHQAKPNSPEIEYIDEYLSDSQMASLYRSCHCFVSPYRGEGFSLPTLEAMASGLPVIVTAGGATDDFVDEAVGWTLPSTSRSIGTQISGHELVEEAFLLEPDLESLIVAMKEAFNRPGFARQKGWAGLERARQAWTWRHATIKMLSRMDILCGTTMAIAAENNLAVTSDTIDRISVIRRAWREQDHDTFAHESQMHFQEDPDSPYSLELRILTADLALTRGDQSAVQKNLALARLKAPDHPDVLYLSALLEMEGARLEKALAQIAPLVQNWRKRRFESVLSYGLDTILTDVARILWQAGSLADALDFANQAIDINSRSSVSHLVKALALKSLHRPEEARAAFHQALNLDPGLSDFNPDFS